MCRDYTFSLTSYLYKITGGRYTLAIQIALESSVAITEGFNLTWSNQGRLIDYPDSKGCRTLSRSSLGCLLKKSNLEVARCPWLRCSWFRWFRHLILDWLSASHAPPFSTLFSAILVFHLDFHAPLMAGTRIEIGEYHIDWIWPIQNNQGPRLE